MKNITQYITEYNGFAAHNGIKSIGDPDEIRHYFKYNGGEGFGFVRLKFHRENAYAFIYNKKLNKIVFGTPGLTHNGLLAHTDEDVLEDAGLSCITSVKQLRYCCGMDDDTEAINAWYKENKEYVDNIICGRLWYDTLDDVMFYDSDEDKKTAENFDEIKHPEDIHIYIANWTEILPNDFKKVNDNIVKEFCKTHNTGKQQYYIAIDNNGEPIEMDLTKSDKINIDKRSNKHQQEIEQAWQYHTATTPEGRKKKHELIKGYIQARDAHFQRDYYDKTKSKTAAEWHNNKTKRYNPRTKKMEWGEKIGDSLQMKSLQDYIVEHMFSGKKITAASQGKTVIKYNPETKDELKEAIKTELDNGNTNLNCIDTFKITDMKYLFTTYDGIKLTDEQQKTLDVSNWDVSNVIHMDGVFCGCTQFNSDLSKWNVSKVKTMREMFRDCKQFNSDLSKWNVSNVIDMYYMFINCTTFNSDLSKWDVSNVKDMKFMFNDCKYFNSDLSKWNVSKVTNMYGMFWNCERFNSDLSNWDVSNVEHMTHIFGNCKQFNSDLSKWDVSNIKNMTCMFAGCERFDSDLSNWKVSKVTNMMSMFKTCTKFTGKGLENWNVSKVRYMDHMFDGCKQFNSDLSKWKVSNVAHMKEMFKDCKKFNSNLSKWNVSKVINMGGMFYGCKQFNSDLSNWNVSKVKYMGNVFTGSGLAGNEPAWYKK